MEIKTVDFLLGVAMGGVLALGLGFAIRKVRAWLGYSEAGKLEEENRALKRRLAEKDRHIGRMLSEMENLAQRLGERMAGKKE